MDVRLFGRFDDLFVARVEVSVGDVFLDGAGEKEDVLGDHADIPAEGVAGQGGDVLPVDRDFAACHLVKPRDEVAEGGLAAARGADQRHRPARVDVEGEVLDDHVAGLVLLAGLVLEAHVVEVDGALDAGQLFRVRVLGLLLLGHQLLKALEAGRAVLQLLKEVDELAHRIEEHVHIEQVGGEAARVDLAVEKEQPARDQHDQVHKVGKKSGR